MYWGFIPRKYIHLSDLHERDIDIFEGIKTGRCQASPSCHHIVPQLLDEWDYGRMVEETLVENERDDTSLVISLDNVAKALGYKEKKLGL